VKGNNVKIRKTLRGKVVLSITVTIAWIVESQYKKGDSELLTLPGVLYFTARDAL